MVTTHDHSSDTEQPIHSLRKHTRSSSSDQAKPQSYTNVSRSIEQDLPPASPTSNKPKSTERPQGKRRKSSASSKHKTRPAYSRKYSTPPSRPLSPSGFPQMLEPDMIIPEIDLNQATQRLQPFQFQQEVHFQALQVDTAPQEPDLWSDPETDYFSSIEGSTSKHTRGKSRRQISQNLGNAASLNAMLAPGNGGGLQQISEDAEAEFHGMRIPGGFAV